MRGGRLPAPLVHLWITTSIDPSPRSASRVTTHVPVYALTAAATSILATRGYVVRIRSRPLREIV
jgi:hypothetical protein